MSGAPIMSGTNQLPKPPISAGMTMKKIMMTPCIGDVHVIHVLGRRRSRCRATRHEIMREMIEDLNAGLLQLDAHRTDSTPPMTPAMIAKIR